MGNYEIDLKSVSTTGNIYNLPVLSYPGYTLGTDTPYTYRGTLNENWMVGDQITFNPHFSLLAGANEPIYKMHPLTTSGTENHASAYDTSKLTPSFSLVYKPTDWVTTYATYIQSLQNGTQVLNSGTN